MLDKTLTILLYDILNVADRVDMVWKSDRRMIVYHKYSNENKTELISININNLYSDKLGYVKYDNILVDVECLFRKEISLTTITGEYDIVNIAPTIRLLLELVREAYPEVEIVEYKYSYGFTLKEVSLLQIDDVIYHQINKNLDIFKIITI